MQYDMQHAMPPELRAPQPYHQPPPFLNGAIKSENGSERRGSPDSPDDSSRYSTTPAQQLQAYHPMPSGLQAGDMRYPSPSNMQTPISMMNNGYVPAPTHPASYGQDAPQAQPQQAHQPGSRSASGDSGPPKAFACSTCGKGFARRSDLARHGMLHQVAFRVIVCSQTIRTNPQRRPSARLRLP